jgi:hypothetical protein
MPRLIDNIRNGRSPLTPSPAEIEARIGEAESKLADVEAEHSRAALEAEAGVVGAGERLSAVLERRAGLNARLETLRSALGAARADERAREARQRAKLFKDNLARITAALERRDAAAARLSEHIGHAVSAWRELVELSDKAALPLPGMSPLPMGCLTNLGELRRALEQDIYRQGAKSLAHATDFPGGKAHDIELLDAPERLPALPDVVKQGSAFALARVAEGAAG